MNQLPFICIIFKLKVPVPFVDQICYLIEIVNKFCHLLPVMYKLHIAKQKVVQYFNYR